MKKEELLLALPTLQDLMGRQLDIELPQTIADSFLNRTVPYSQ
jgi:hypothetical protein